MIYTINDLHLDFHISLDSTEDFAEKILPSQCGGTLLIPGDIGHNNKQNARFLAVMAKHFDDVVLVMGNHDYYNIGASSSEYRIEQAREMYADAGAILLEGTTHTTKDGTVIGGGSGWCDLRYGKIFGFPAAMTYQMIYSNFSDSKYIDCIRANDWDSYREWAREKYNELKRVLHADIIISHYPFDEGAIAPQYEKDHYTSFFIFEGDEFYEEIKGKIWCAGHTHTPYDYVSQGCRFVNNPLGYPHEQLRTTIKKL